MRAVAAPSPDAPPVTTAESVESSFTETSKRMQFIEINEFNLLN
jgi:hypothetical protein